MRLRGDCSRPNCDLAARHRGLCRDHYAASVGWVTGYVDGTATRERLRLLRSRGFSWQSLAELTGRSDEGLRQVGDRVQAGMEQAVLNIPIPGCVEPGGGLVPAVGSIRRLQALAVAGWPFTLLSVRLGYRPRWVCNIVRSPSITARNARLIADVFDELQLIPGPSDIARRRRRQGLAPGTFLG